MKNNKIINALLAIICVCSFTRCVDFFEPESDTVLLDRNYIGNVNELYSGYMGIAARVQAAGDHAIILSELRSDLLEPTEHAPQELWDIYHFKEGNDNPFANPKGYYDIIIHADNYIKKAFEFKEQNPKAVDNSIFEPLIGGAIRFKVWAYLMLGKLYGKAVYLNSPLMSYADISNLPVLEFDDLVQELIHLMEVGENEISGRRDLPWADILNTNDITWNMLCPSPEPLLMELNLWAGNYQRVVDLAIPFIYDNGSDRFKIRDLEGGGNFYRAWALPFDDTRYRVELINFIPYDYERNQTNRLMQFFAKQHPGKYYLRPTTATMERYDEQRHFVVDLNRPGDYFRKDMFVQQGGDWVFRKYMYGSAWQVHQNNARVSLYRACDVHLFLIEALNNLGKFAEAEAFLNDGITTYVSLYSNNLQAPLDNPVFNAAMTRHNGIRRRANLAPVYPEGLSKDELYTQEDIDAYKKALDILLVEETAMESSGEARSLFAMIRIAKRWNDPAILADRISAKYPEGMKSNIHAHLMNPNNWFVSFDLK